MDNLMNIFKDTLEKKKFVVSIDKENDKNKIKELLYESTEKNQEYYPKFVNVYHITEREAFIQTLFYIIFTQKREKFVDPNFKTGMYNNLQKDFNITKDEFDDIINFVHYGQPFVIKEEEEEEIESPGSYASFGDIPLDEEDRQILNNEEKKLVNIYILRYSILFDKVEKIPQTINLTNESVIAKAKFGEENTYLTQLDGITKYQSKAIKIFTCSENLKGKPKKLYKGVTHFLYAQKEFYISGKIFDEGIVRMDVEFKKNFYENIAENNEKVSKVCKKIYIELFNKESVLYKIFNIDLRIIYKEYYLTNDHFASLFKGNLKNNIVYTEQKGFKMYYSSKNQFMNFNFKELENLQKIQEAIVVVENLEKYIKTNGKIEKNKKEVQSIKQNRDAGIDMNSYKCEKKRQPVLVKEDENIEAGVETFTNEDKTFKCNINYPYHGKNGKIDCCYKKSQQNKIQEFGAIGIKNNKDYIKKYAVLKKYINLSKYKKSIIVDEIVKGVLPGNFNLLSVGNEKEEKTLENCLKEMYDIEASVTNLSKEHYDKYINNGLDINEWKAKPEKSITEIIFAVSSVNDVSIIVLYSSEEGLRSMCPIITNKSKYVFIQEHSGLYYVIIEEYLDDIIYEFSMDNQKIKKLVDLAKQSCDVLDYSSREYNNYTIENEIIDINGMVVFLKIKDYGIIPVSPSSSTNIQKLSINGVSFLKPEEQYTKLLSFIHKPVGYTTLLDTDIVTGIKLSNNLISPVINTIWINPPIEKVDELFYIERYFNNKDVFIEENKKFLENLKIIEEVNDLQKYIESQDYISIIRILGEKITDEEELSKIIWYLLNK